METKTLTLNLMSLYHLTYDPNNDTGYTLDEVRQLIEEHGADHEVEATVTVGLNPVDVTATEVVDPAQLESAPVDTEE